MKKMQTTEWELNQLRATFVGISLFLSVVLGIAAIFVVVAFLPWWVGLSALSLVALVLLVFGLITVFKPHWIWDPIDSE